jgi:hypothetical protein
MNKEESVHEYEAIIERRGKYQQQAYIFCKRCGNIKRC